MLVLAQLTDWLCQTAPGNRDTFGKLAARRSL